MDVMDRSDALDCGGPGREGVLVLNTSAIESIDMSGVFCWGDTGRGDKGGNPSMVSFKSIQSETQKC